MLLGIIAPGKMHTVTLGVIDPVLEALNERLEAGM
jgi:hypothetical protein